VRQVPYRIVSHRGKFYVERGRHESDQRSGESWITWSRDSAEQMPFDEPPLVPRPELPIADNERR
jgi:hypothetical protein